MMKSVKLAVLALGVAGIGIVLYGGSLYASIHDPILATDPVFYTVKSGATLTTVAQELQDRGVIKSAFTLRFISRLEGQNPVQAADYQFMPGISVLELYQDLVQGKSLSPERQVTLVEGWTIPQMADELAEVGIIASAEAFITASTQNTGRFEERFTFLAERPAEASLEGYLFPDTYRFFPLSEPDVVIEKLLTTFDRQVDEAMRAQVRASGRSLHDFVILASIVEREVRSPDEMAVVAGIFSNRLEVGMALQADSTVNYITSSGRARSTYEDLAIDSPYNTYKYAGLPKGPISNPGINALRAAAKPADTEYFFFLTDPAGKVYYGKTLEEHNRNRIYL